MPTDAPTHVASFQLANGDIIWAEVARTDADTPDNPSQPGRASRSKTEQSPQFEQAIAAIRPAADAVFSLLKEMNTPETIELEFGITLSGKVGAIFASAKTDANFKVKLAWKNDSTDKPAPPPTDTSAPPPQTAPKQ